MKRRVRLPALLLVLSWVPVAFAQPVEEPAPSSPAGDAAPAAAETPAPLTPIPGTQVSLPVPPGFEVAERFAGLVREDTSASVLVSEIPAPAEAIRGSMTRERMGPGGLTLHEIENVSVSGMEGSLAYASQVSEGIAYRKWLLVFGNERRTVSIIAMVPATFADRMEAPLREVLRGVKWHPDQEVDLFDGLGFRIDESEGLRVSERVANMLFLTKPREEGPLRSGDPLFIVGISKAEEGSSDLARLSREKLREIQEVRSVVLVSEGPIALDGIAGYEIVAEAEDIASRTPVLVYQALARRPDGRVILMQGLVGEGRGAAILVQFRAVAESFQRTGIGEGFVAEPRDPSAGVSPSGPEPAPR